MSHCRQQIFIEAPPEAVWELLRDAERHGDWWAGFVEVECDGLEPGCTYRQVNTGPFGHESEETFEVERMEDSEALSIRCLDTGTFVRFVLTEARGGTFVDGEAGMEPSRHPPPRLGRGRRTTLVPRLAGQVAGLESESRAAGQLEDGLSLRGVGDRGLEPRTSSLSETRSNQLS